MHRQRAKSLGCWQPLGLKGPCDSVQVISVRQRAIEHCYFLVKDSEVGFEIFFILGALCHKQMVIA